MKWVLRAVVVLAVCACGFSQYSDPYNQGQYGYGQQNPNQQQPGQQQPIVQEHATFKIDSVEKVFNVTRDGSTIQECAYEKIEIQNTDRQSTEKKYRIYLAAHFVSADGNSSMRLALDNLDEMAVFATWDGSSNTGKTVTLVLDKRNANSTYTNQTRIAFTGTCQIYYQLERELLQVRHFSCTGLQNGQLNQSRQALTFTGSGEFACNLKAKSTTSLR